MKFTGERVIPGQGDRDLLNEHMARYRFAQRYSSGKVVLDVACGSGYGSALLGENAKAVVGIDISGEAVEYAHSHYGSATVRFGQSDCLALPFPSGLFDVIVAFEIIEHLTDAEAFLKELYRVLHPSGLLILSTPNRLYYTEERGATNPFHHREFSFPELEEILRPVFPHRAILFENHIPGIVIAGPETVQKSALSSSVVREEAGTAEGQKPDAAAQQRAAHYFLALCSLRPLAPVDALFYLPSTGNVLRERETHIRLLTQYLEEANAQTDQARAAMERARADAEAFRTQLEPLQAQAEALRAELVARTRWAKDLDRELSEKGSYLLQLQADYDAKVQWALSLDRELQQARAVLEQVRKEFEERTAWALRLDSELQRCAGDLRLLYGSLWYRIGRNLRLTPTPPSDHRE